MKKGTKNIAATVSEIISPVAEELGYYLWDVEFVKEGSRYILRVTIDSEEGINIDDCEKMHRAIDPVLDEADPIENAYYLEVSSPGIERELRTDEHILACLGETVEVKLYAPLNGVKSFVGELFGYEDGRVSVKNGEKVNSFERKEIAHIKTVFDFGD
ncbi:MAG: ribosome maturation factor RimP [Clostridia bacterium]|nr:ribosome maturation factor RimP [Clostridia bacterium]